MKRVMQRAGAMMATFAIVFAVACGRQETTPPADATAPAPAASPAPASAGTAEITFNPATPTTGENTFEVMVMQDGKPVDDAQVSVEFFMAAMPQMNMKEMRMKADLMPMGKGMYQGRG